MVMKMMSKDEIENFLEEKYNLNEKLSITGTSKSKYNKIIIEDFVNYILDKYNIQIPKLKIKIIKKINKKTFGYVDLYSLEKGIYEIKIEDGGTIYILSLISHELTHIIQYLTNKLNYEDNMIVWNNKPYITLEDYNSLDIENYKKLPWEKEAYDNQDKLFNEYKSKTKFSNIKNKDTTLDFLIDNDLL